MNIIFTLPRSVGNHLNREICEGNSGSIAIKPDFGPAKHTRQPNLLGVIHLF